MDNRRPRPCYSAGAGRLCSHRCAVHEAFRVTRSITTIGLIGALCCCVCTYIRLMHSSAEPASATALFLLHAGMADAPRRLHDGGSVTAGDAAASSFARYDLGRRFVFEFQRFTVSSYVDACAGSQFYQPRRPVSVYSREHGCVEQQSVGVHFGQTRRRASCMPWLDFGYWTPLSALACFC